MREIGTIENEEQAKQFSDYLLIEGIENHVEDEDGEWIIWIYSEDKTDRARDLFTQFQHDPTMIDSEKVTQKAHKIRLEEKKEAAAYKKLMQKSRVKFQSASGIGKITRILIIISGLVFLISGLGSNWQNVKFLAIANYEIVGNTVTFQPNLSDVFHGQLWRLITPIFIHGDILHILFNMFWLYYLGSQVENIQGIRVYLLLVLTIAIISNVCQFYVSGPMFGGMSGVNYGLLGYIWIRSKFDPLSGLNIENYLIVWMLLWFFLGLTGLVGNVANTVHGVGLVVGMAWGYVFARIKTLKR